MSPKDDTSRKLGTDGGESGMKCVQLCDGPDSGEDCTADIKLGAVA